MSEQIIFSVPAIAIFEASKAGIREKDWREKLNKLGGENICKKDGAIQCTLPLRMWGKYKTEIENFSKGNLFPDAMVFEKTEGLMIVHLGKMRLPAEQPFDFR